MAKDPTRISALQLSSIMKRLRGNFDFPKNTSQQDKRSIAYGGDELISHKAKSRILEGALRVLPAADNQRVSAGSIMNLAQTNLSRIGSERVENRKILNLMPDVAKAARLIIASIFSPNDLSRHEIKVMFDLPDMSEEQLSRLSEYATTFFQKKLNLKTAARQWVYEFGYEAGSSVFAIVPLTSFAKIQDESYIGTENIKTRVVEPLCQESLFQFGDSPLVKRSFEQDLIGLESLVDDVFQQIREDKDKTKTGDVAKNKELVKSFLAQEALSLTDNPAVLQVPEMTKKKQERRSKSIIRNRFAPPLSQPLLSISNERDLDKKDGLVGNPILFHLPPESVTVIHTPGDPSDHQGYFVILDQLGNPINVAAHEESHLATSSMTNTNASNIFTQSYNAYGVTPGSRSLLDDQTKNYIYTKVVTEHLKKRLDKAGFSNAEIANTDAVMRCMFNRYMQEKQTRVLFLPKELVTYMAFELDQNGNGISRLDRIKFVLGLKMAVQVSRVLAAIKGAMDKRKVNIRFTDNLMEPPEAVFQSVIREYLRKSTLSFSIDPAIIQNQLADKSMSLTGTNIPGLEEFEITNEPDQRTGSFDFDPNISESLDKQALNGLNIPAATMNSLDEAEYARSVTTTNLFFAMDISVDQDLTIKHISDLIRKFGTYSEEFINGLYEILPFLKTKNVDKNIGIEASTQETSQDRFPDKTAQDDADVNLTYSVDDIISKMSISLPPPNIAPSKAQFETIDAMVSSITNLMSTLFPDELAGPDDSLRQVVATLRSRFTVMNVRDYVEKSGLSGVQIPGTNFTSVMGEMSQLYASLTNVKEMFEQKIKLNGGVEADPSGQIPGQEPDFGQPDGFSQDEGLDDQGLQNPQPDQVDGEEPQPTPNPPAAKTPPEDNAGY